MEWLRWAAAIVATVDQVFSWRFVNLVTFCIVLFRRQSNNVHIISERLSHFSVPRNYRARWTRTRLS